MALIPPLIQKLFRGIPLPQFETTIISIFTYTAGPRYNAPRYNADLVITRFFDPDPFLPHRLKLSENPSQNLDFARLIRVLELESVIYCTFDSY